MQMPRTLLVHNSARQHTDGDLQVPRSKTSFGDDVFAIAGLASKFISYELMDVVAGI